VSSVRHLASRLYYHELIVETANSLGIAPFYWDNGWTGTNGSGIFNRNSATVFDQDTVDALTGGPRLDGDFNGDGTVDAIDYTVWRDGLNSAYTEADYQIWKDNFGMSLFSGQAQSGAQVPEPAAIYLCLLAAGWRLSTGCRRRHDG
jgi:hypothetical protein